MLPFLTTWQTSSANETITLPVLLPLISPLNISWGDNQVEFFNTSTGSPITHLYNDAGLHNVSIQGDIYKFRFISPDDNARKIVDISSWGDGFFVDSDSRNMFADCVNLHVSASPMNQPVFLLNATLEGMFKNSSFNSALNWNLTNVRSLALMFQHATRLNQPITFTNAEGVTDVTSMFANASSFNQSVSLNTSNVRIMTAMFQRATNFNHPVNFDTRNVGFMDLMFSEAVNFNQPVPFNTSDVLEISQMFSGAASFNQQPCSVVQSASINL